MVGRTEGELKELAAEWADWACDVGVTDKLTIDQAELDALLGFDDNGGCISLGQEFNLPPHKPTVTDALISWHRSKNR